MTVAAMLRVNGRFLTQKVTGVQRFAIEMTRALQGIAGCDVIAPHGARDEGPIIPRRAGFLSGHAWEQFELPRHAEGGVLLNLGNTAPLMRGNQIVVIHDARPFTTPGNYSWRFATWYRLMQRGLARRGTCIVTVSCFAQQELAQHLRLDPAGIAVLGEGAEHLLRTPPDLGLCHRLGLDRPYVLAVGSLARHKNLASLSATAMMLTGRGMDLVLIGDVDRRVFGAGASGLPASLRGVGRQDDAGLRTLYEGAACFVFPSRDESFGLPAVEAMACGCPVVAARAGSLPEICGDAALLVDPDDPAEIAAAVERVIDDPELFARLRAAGRARAAGFTWAAAAGRLAALAEGLAARENGARGNGA